MAKPARGLPSGFSLNLPDEGPVEIGDFLDEAPPVLHRKPSQAFQQPVERAEPHPFTPEIVSPRTQEEREPAPARPVQRKAQSSKVIRYQLNLTPKSKTMFEELMKTRSDFQPRRGHPDERSISRRNRRSS